MSLFVTVFRCMLHLLMHFLNKENDIDIRYERRKLIIKRLLYIFSFINHCECRLKDKWFVAYSTDMVWNVSIQSSSSYFRNYERVHLLCIFYILFLHLYGFEILKWCIKGIFWSKWKYQRWGFFKRWNYSQGGIIF